MPLFLAISKDETGESFEYMDLRLTCATHEDPISNKENKGKERGKRWKGKKMELVIHDRNGE